MSKLKWDQVGERGYETGVDRGVLYVQSEGKYPKGVAWNGLSEVDESPSGAEPTALYANILTSCPQRSMQVQSKLMYIRTTSASAMAPLIYCQG